MEREERVERRRLAEKEERRKSRPVSANITPATEKEERRKSRPVSANITPATEKEERRKSRPVSAHVTPPANVDFYNPLIRFEKHKVIVHVTFLKIGEINTLKEQFDADVLIKSRWREPLLDNYHPPKPVRPQPSTPNTASTKNGDIVWEKYWDPKLSIDNFVTEPKLTMSRVIERDMNGAVYVLERRRVKGSFVEQLELGEFPFDVQDLSVTIISDLPAEEIEIIEDPNEIHKIYKQSFIDEQEWYLYKYVESVTIQRLKDMADPTAMCRALIVKCRAARRPEYFMWNILSVTALITILSFTTFAVPHTMPQNRLQLTFTLILTSVAFKFVVHQSLPRISYLTYLDRYILATMGMLTTICLWHGAQTQIDAVDDHDYAALFVLLGLYIIYNLQFFIRIMLVPYRKRREMKKRENEYTQIVKVQALERASTRKSSHAGPGEDEKVVKRQGKQKKKEDRESMIPLASLEDV